MKYGLCTCARRALLAAAILAGLHGTASASAFSVEVTPFPAGGLYVPVGGQVDPSNPLFIYEALFFPPVFSIPDVVPGVTEYMFPIALSAVPDPAIGDVLLTGGGTMYVSGGAGGVFTTCWSLGCTPEDGLVPFFEVFGSDLAFVLRVDPDAGRSSVGTMTVAQVAGGFLVDSFFDIFVEVCTLNCDTFDVGDEVWEDVAGSVRYELVEELPAAEVPEPSTLLLLGVGLAGAGARAWRARRPA